MTIDRAIYILENCDAWDEQYEEACQMGIDALRKQIPKEPTYEGDGYSDGVMVYDMAYCPNCGKAFEEEAGEWGDNYCPNCGQRLDWSEA